jgi:hypothetical protein
MSQRIFLSYAQQDQGIVGEVKRQLLKQGLVTGDDLIIDPKSDIKSGDNIREAIRRQMRDANKVVIIHSADSAQSQWVNYEAGMASALGKPVVVVRTPGSGKTAFTPALSDVGSIEFINTGRTRKRR